MENQMNFTYNYLSHFVMYAISTLLPCEVFLIDFTQTTKAYSIYNIQCVVIYMISFYTSQISIKPGMAFYKVMGNFDHNVGRNRVFIEVEVYSFYAC